MMVLSIILRGNQPAGIKYQQVTMQIVMALTTLTITIQLLSAEIRIMASPLITRMVLIKRITWILTVIMMASLTVWKVGIQTATESLVVRRKRMWALPIPMEMGY